LNIDQRLEIAMRNLRFLSLFLLTSAAFSQKLSQIPAAFTENKGQIIDQNNRPNSEVLFMYSGKGINVQLRKTGYSYELFKVPDLALPVSAKKSCPQPQAQQNIKIQTSRIDIEFLGMNKNVQVVSTGSTKEIKNFIRPGQEIYEVHSFQKIIYKNIYDHIDIEFKINSAGNIPLKYDIVLHPGADLSQIKFLCSGANSISADDAEIKMSTAFGDLSEKIPFSYYNDSPAQNKKVDFILKNNEFSFFTDHDRSKTLVIDPSSNIIWGTYFGGAALENCTGNGIDAQNNIYITGQTQSNSNIATLGAFQSTLNGSVDIYLAKFDSNGGILWATYFGGSGFEQAYGIFVEANGTVYISGDTNTNSGMATAGAHQTIYGGGIDDCLLAKFDTNGQRLWSTYYGGTEHDFANSITVDASGNVIIAGHTESSNTGSCIATSGAYATNFTFFVDAFVAKFNNNGVRQWGTYYGETGNEEALGVAADPTGNVIITGFTSSFSNISTPNGYQPFFGGGTLDGFVAKFDPSGATLIWGTYYGSAAEEQSYAVQTNSLGDIFVGGYSSSNFNIASPGAYQTTHGGAEDAFLVKFDAAGQRQWCTYFGGSGTEYLYDVMLDNQSNVWISGQTTSTASIASADAYQPAIGMVNTYDGYFAKFTSNGQQLKLASYYGKTGDEAIRGMVLDNANKLYVSGETTSPSGMTTPSSYQPNYGGVQDAFLGKFCSTPKPFITPASTHTMCLNDTWTLTATAGYFSYFWNGGQNTSSIVLSSLTQGNHYYDVYVYDNTGCSGYSDSVTVIVENCITGLSEQNNLDAISVFPSPASEKIFLQNIPLNSSKNILRIVASDGKIVLTKEIRNSNEAIEVKELSEGLYFIEIRCGDNTFTRKFIKN
jgi:hypothetical protein